MLGEKKMKVEVMRLTRWLEDWRRVAVDPLVGQVQ